MAVARIDHLTTEPCDGCRRRHPMPTLDLVELDERRGLLLCRDCRAARPPRSRGEPTSPTACGCPACALFLADYRDPDTGRLDDDWRLVAENTAANLHTRGWAGGLMEAERAYMNAHGPAWYRRASALGRRYGHFPGDSRPKYTPGRRDTIGEPFDEELAS
jgi:hypothetical protein